MRVAADVGTFTDLVTIGPEGIVTAKVDATPLNSDQKVPTATDKANKSQVEVE